MSDIKKTMQDFNDGVATLFKERIVELKMNGEKPVYTDEDGNVFVNVGLIEDATDALGLNMEIEEVMGRKDVAAAYLKSASMYRVLVYVASGQEIPRLV